MDIVTQQEATDLLTMHQRRIICFQAGVKVGHGNHRE